MKDIIRFQDALDIAQSFVAKNYSLLSDEPLLIRDFYGKIRVVLQCEPIEQHLSLAEQLANSLGNFAYSANETFLYANDLFNSDSIINSPDKLKIPDTAPPIYLLDRQITGQDWLRKPLITENDKNRPPRVTLFGIKGGVGRSTALAVLAWHLADKLEKKVLIIDLYLESPGIGQIMLPKERLADFGVVDWLIEDAVGQADDLLLREMVANSPLSDNSIGQIRVVSAVGSKEQDYIAKLSRIYMDINQAGTQTDFAHRLEKMLNALEAQEKPDIVLLDSRAGIHDIAAIAITRLSDLALLFAINTPQTWQAYQHLFNHWLKWNTHLQNFRGNLKLVAAMIPETERENYIGSLTENAYELFLTLYDESVKKEDNDSAEDDIDYFNFDINAIDAPHYPLKIFWYRAFQDFSPLKQFNPQDVELCYGSFLQEVTQLILE